MKSNLNPRHLSAAFALISATMVAGGWAADQPQWGQQYTRNMVSGETGLPESFDPQTGENVKWSASLGTESYATPVVGGGRVIIGANNGEPRDPRHQGDRGVLLCLNEEDGSICWQLVVPKFQGDVYLDWPGAGICSPATVEGDRVYAVTNRAEVVCLDLAGMANGNGGPYVDEGRHLVLPGEKPMEVGQLDADILWLFDMRAEVGMHPHDAAHSSILIDGPYLYLNTGNGVDNTHRKVRAPEAPSLIVLDKTSGKLVAQDGERIGPRIFHCTWSSPALADVAGRRLVFFGGGDGVCYAFDALTPSSTPGPAKTLPRAWRFDCDPTAPKEDVSQYLRNRRVSPSNIKSMPVFHENRVYLTVGGDIWWGKNEAWLQCIDATQTGNITETGLLWSYALNRHCCSTPSIHNGLVFTADCGRTVHCVDASTGEACWTHEANGEIWGSTLVADGRVYVGTRRGDLWVFAAAREKRVLGCVELDSPTASTPVAANGVLYMATLRRLWAFQKPSP
ncbi:MAG: PQQ-binding-like beta-propeller repeat protein [Pirellulales bacterium]|nr:PQQ-binding-like beta-propeller repeat protein [Pirellulales bacterium]